MYDVVANALNGRGQEPEGLRKMIGISIGAHIALMAAIVILPAGWFARQSEIPKDALIISLGGAPGPTNGGMTPISGRPVQKVMPDVPKQQPVRPPAQKTPEMTVPDPTLKAKPPKPAPTPVQEAPKEARGKTPTVGTQAKAGRAMANTGSQSENTLGLSTGGGGTGGQIQLANFCCPEYVGEMVNRINQNWSSRQQAPGTTTMRFTIQRDGTITDITVAQSSGYQMLDFLAQRALMAVSPLPLAYTTPTLTVTLNFEYQR
jgi:periplasmic protein TonB